MKKFALASVLIVLGCGLASCDDSKDSSLDCGQYPNTKAAFNNVMMATSGCQALQVAEQTFNSVASTENFPDSEGDRAVCMGEWLSTLPESYEKNAMDAWNAFDASCSSQLLETLKPLMPGLNPGSSNNNNNNNNNNNCDQLIKTKAALSYAVNLDGTNCDTLKTAAAGIANAAFEEKAIASAADTKGLNDLLTTCAESWGVTQAQRAAFDNHLSACNTNTDPQKDKCDEIPNTKSAFETVIAMDGSDCEAFKAAQNSFAETAVAEGVMTSAEDASGLESVKTCGEKWGMDSTALSRYSENLANCSSAQTNVCDNAAVKASFNDIFSQKECNNMMSSLDSFNQAAAGNSFTDDDKNKCANQWIDDVIVWNTFKDQKTCPNNEAFLEMIAGRCDLATESKAAFGSVFTDHDDCSKLGEAVGNYFTASADDFKNDMGTVCADLWLINDMLHAFVKLLSSEKFKDCESQFIDYLKELGRLPSLAFDKESDVAQIGDKASFKLTYLNADKTPVDGAFIQLSSSDDTCIKVDNSVKSGNDGVAEGQFVVQKGSCTATITAKTPLASAAMSVVVPESLGTQIMLSLDSRRYDSVGFAAYLLTTDDCDSLDDAKITSLLGNAYNQYDDSTEDIKVSGKPLLAVFNAGEIDAAKKSVLAYAKINAGDKKLLALGCKNISGKAITVDMEATPTQMDGKFDLVSNFDLVNSGFEKTPCNASNTYKNSGICVPAIEDMKPGDWVTFTTDLYHDPLITVLEFAWSNIFQRVMNIKDEQGNSPWPMIQMLMVNINKLMAISALEPYLAGSLGNTGSQYSVFKKIEPDSVDLTSNMQLAGIMEVLDADGATVKKVRDTYKELQYQWSYDQKNCIANAYGNSKCRKRISLTNSNDLEMSGEWNGSITLSKNGDTIGINSHSQNFKWASMLLMASFGSMLPDALDYKVTNNQYMKAFLTKVLFVPVVNAYNADAKNKDKKVTLKTGKECEAFIEAYFNMLLEGTSSQASIIQSFASIGCSSKGIGGIDEALVGKGNCSGNNCGVLGSFQSSAENPMAFSSKGCSLYDEGTINYTSFGKPDEPVVTAGSVFGSDKKKTDRCTWDTQLVIGGKSVSLKGIFHAVRQK